MKPLGSPLDEMRALLTALDVIADGAVTPDALDEARSVFAGFHERAKDSCARLRTQLVYAEEFTSIENARRLRRQSTSCRMSLPSRRTATLARSSFL